ncbi:helix-turn-helix domain-containing protein [Mesorhizobium ciceri]|uniref:helix-turn-helix domain-containing protein n=1 Tax=Mesorhizobium TaxID=68287 RepID=UPI00047B3FE6|nr:helix-turn-helix domain-containing protein [Mesorhizobium ciceri]
MVSKYDWGKACRYFQGFRDSPGAQRVAGALVDLYNDKVHCAYPTRETLSQQLGAAPETVSKWIAILKEGGALSCVPLRVLPPEHQAIIGRSARRAQVYLLKFSWAVDVLSMMDEYQFERKQQLLYKVTIPSPLLPIGDQVVTSDGNQMATLADNHLATLIPYDHTLDHTLEDKRGSESSALSAYTRERAA